MYNIDRAISLVLFTNTHTYIGLIKYFFPGDFLKCDVKLDYRWSGTGI